MRLFLFEGKRGIFIVRASKVEQAVKIVKAEDESATMVLILEYGGEEGLVYSSNPTNIGEGLDYADMLEHKVGEVP